MYISTIQNRMLFSISHQQASAYIRTTMNGITYTLKYTQMLAHKLTIATSAMYHKFFGKRIFGFSLARAIVQQPPIAAATTTKAYAPERKRVALFVVG